MLGHVQSEFTQIICEQGLIRTDPNAASSLHVKASRSKVKDFFFTFVLCLKCEKKQKFSDFD